MINYSIIAHSIEYYANQGFKRIESPWTVTASISGLTKPVKCNDFTIKEKSKVLVASGEQSFLYLYNKGFLPKGQYQTVTPCFRDELFTPYHTKYFIKNELIKTDSTTLRDLQRIVHVARDFFRAYCLLAKDESYGYVTNEPDDVLIMDTTNGRNMIVDDVDVMSTHRWQHYDLMYRGVELGS